jgi:Putative transposase DNA-binding domain
MSTRIYKFGARPPIDGGEAVAEREISGAHKYFNAMIELARWNLQQKADLREEYLPDFAERNEQIAIVESQLDLERGAIKKQNAVTRKRTATDDQKISIQNLRDWLSILRGEKRAALLAVEENQEYMNACADLHEQVNAKKRELYSKADCGWGTRLKIVADVEAACKGCTPDDPPKFRRWTGDGIIAVQIQGGMSWQEIIGNEDGRFRAEPMEGQSAGNRKRNGQRTLFRLRIGSDELRRPVWLTVPAVLGRKFSEYFPKDATIKWAYLVRRRGPYLRMGENEWKPRDLWEIQLSTGTDEEKPQAESGICGVDLGWRLMDDGSLRVAYWAANDGEEGELRIDPARWLACDEMAATRGGKFEDTKQILVKYLTASQDKIPELMREDAKFVHLWKSPGRLVRFINSWIRHDGDGGVYALLVYWRDDDTKLAHQEFHMRLSAKRWRLDVFRCFASRLAKRYRDLSVEDCDWRKLNALPDVEKNESVNAVARRMMRIASVGLLRQCLAQSGADVQFNETANTTKECWKCGHDNEWDDKLELSHTCAGCGNVEDQDRNAAMILLARGSAVKTDQGKKGDGLLGKSGPKPAIVPNGTARESEPDAESNLPVAGQSGNGRWQRRKREALARRTTNR